MGRAVDSAFLGVRISVGRRFERTASSASGRAPQVATPAALLAVLAVLAGLGTWRAVGADGAEPRREFFERKIRPLLVEHCLRCHGGEGKEHEGGLRLDLRAGWQRGGDSGRPAVVPGRPEASPLLAAVRHDADASAMPPDRPKLSDAAIADLTAWIKDGAFDPRDGEATIKRKASWDETYVERTDWWSLRAPVDSAPPPVADPERSRGEVDAHLLAALDARGLAFAPPADRRTLARRLAFTLTGLPPDPADVEAYLEDESPDAWERLVDRLLHSPRFGERWARHWMDVVHYSDTHGYEWDAPAKHAWRYRDYLIRAFNDDVPYDRLVLEQIAGDRIEPRVDARSGVDEGLLGLMALRLGERRHGDSSQVEGVTQEAMANIVDTLGKGFLATTLACAQCHDHKLDAVSQRDYYALTGVFMSSRWNVRTVDAVDPNLQTLEELRTLKAAVREELARIWSAERATLAEKLAALPAPPSDKPQPFPETLLGFWNRARSAPVKADEFEAERRRRVETNQKQLKLVADFTREDGAGGWRWDGWGMRHGLVRSGEPVVAEEGGTAVAQILPAGRWSHVWSKRLAGAVRSPLFPPLADVSLSIGHSAGGHAAQSVVIDQAFHSERMQFLDRPTPGWLGLRTGRFDTLEGSVDALPRRVYVELATKSLNNYFPPRTGYGGLSEAQIADERSWFGVTRVYEHPPGVAPLDELTRFARLFDDATGPAGAEPTSRVVALLGGAVERWCAGACDDEDVRLIDEALQAKLLSNSLDVSPELRRRVEAYRAVERRLQPDRTIGAADDWLEGRNERIGVRGSYVDFGEEAPRGAIRMLGGPMTSTEAGASGRAELAARIADPNNPLTARVYVNRVWGHLFGEGLVRTPDDFGHLGERPSHPELLDSLALRFMADGWSTKRLIRRLVASAAWRQSNAADPRAVELDPENRLWHHRPLRRLEAEAIRDSLLVAAGRLDGSLYGPPIEPYRTATDAAKRLVSGPLDGLGRRSLYTKMTLMEPPRLLALFNQPLPKLTTGRRDVTNVPDQALALLNDPFVVEMARRWGERATSDGAATVEERAARMFETAVARPARPAELERLVRFVRRSGELRGAGSRPLLEFAPAWQDAAHALFNLKEFVYVP